MVPLRFKIPEQMVVPFASPPDEITDISITGVSPDGTYFESESHCAYLDKSKKQALRLCAFRRVWSLAFGPFEEAVGDAGGEEEFEALEQMCSITKDYGNLQTEHERLFVDVYFKWIMQFKLGDPEWASYLRVPPKFDEWCDEPLFEFLLPLPQAHIYVRDPLTSGYMFSPERMLLVDFAFWTGRQLVVLEIDGDGEVGGRDQIWKDRELERSGVRVIHISHEELKKHGPRVISALLPSAITHWWADWIRHPCPGNPLNSLPF